MAVTVIRRGTLPGDQAFAGACIHCGTEFRCLRKDGKHVPEDQRTDEHLIVECPTCHAGAIAYPTDPPRRTATAPVKRRGRVVRQRLFEIDVP